MFEYSRFCTIAIHNFFSVHRPKVIATCTSGNIGKSRIGVDKRGFNLECGLVVESMPMNDVGNFKAGDTNFTDSFQFVTNLVAINFGPAVGENTISLALADVKSLAVSWVN